MADPAYDDDEDSNDTLIHRVLSLGLTPLRILTSRAAIKAYLSTILFLGTSTVLLALSSTAYAFFYYNYIPQISLERVLYLQYGTELPPHATAALDTNGGGLVSQQAYNVELILDMPRTPTNLAAGNFMLDLRLLGSKGVPDAVSSWLGNITMENVLYHSRRPAILPYASPILSLSHTVLHLPWHLLNLRDLDRSHLVVPMFEMLAFPRGARNVPTHARLELQAGSSVLQVYDVKLAFRAKFQGMRYWIYNYRVTAFLVFTAVFYGVSVISMALGWAVISHAFSADGAGQKRIKLEGRDGMTPIKTEHESSSGAAAAKVKTEEDEAGESSGPHGGGLSLSNISDTPTQFPTGRGRPPLSYPGRSTPAAEASRENVEAEEDRLRRPIGPGEAADDEDEGEDFGPLEEDRDGRGRGREGDSGIGTSMESEHVGTGVVRRRSSRGLGKRSS
ncbi:uncharacterized protein Z520_00078 [Fonsecaea multimorphosa CBS 102226]|uniref:Seipin n=1 Tax=Fonsecaea multimorphosa CBS 102226 TaxID=1442371 RepID=A0A0D2J1Y8_9EURO|nr:uncharacterized protein Z520_00078 [Fonsecaea multimorphosa CBS 102226]KIY03387.1 hypothetical protein Z520_00078 [Fonsecaea multimorphosa CBS 102226]OAL33037.1 hypothetical protein AYO22_00122 [Fonsecaea multimorphosa]